LRLQGNFVKNYPGNKFEIILVTHMQSVGAHKLGEIIKFSFLPVKNIQCYSSSLKRHLELPKGIACGLINVDGAVKPGKYDIIFPQEHLKNSLGSLCCALKLKLAIDGCNIFPNDLEVVISLIRNFLVQKGVDDYDLSFYEGQVRKLNRYQAYQSGSICVGVYKVTLSSKEIKAKQLVQLILPFHNEIKLSILIHSSWVSKGCGMKFSYHYKEDKAFFGKAGSRGLSKINERHICTSDPSYCYTSYLVKNTSWNKANKLCESVGYTLPEFRNFTHLQTILKGSLDFLNEENLFSNIFQALFGGSLVKWFSTDESTIRLNPFLVIGKNVLHKAGSMFASEYLYMKKEGVSSHYAS